jgi:hypothetical protein
LVIFVYTYSSCEIETGLEKYKSGKLAVKVVKSVKSVKE